MGQGYVGSRDGAVVRALASHQCGPGLIPETGVICGSSLLLVLVLALRVFSGFSHFPLSTKTNTAKFQFDPEQWTKRHSVEVPLQIPIYFILFIYCIFKDTNGSCCSLEIVFRLEKQLLNVHCSDHFIHNFQYFALRL